MFKKLKEKSYKEGFDEGKIAGYTEGLDYATRYIENYVNTLNQEYKKEQKKQEITKQLTLNLKDVITKQQLYVLDDSMMQWAKSVIEIRDTQFFKTTYFDLKNSTNIKNYIDYIDYLQYTNEIKLQYPQTYYYLPEIKKSLEEVYQNKLIIEKAEKLLE